MRYKNGYFVPDGFKGTMSDSWDAYELYDAAQHFGHQHEGRHGYWTAWYAARATAAALLERAKQIGLSDLQIERLRETAARVATD